MARLLGFGAIPDANSMNTRRNSDGTVEWTPAARSVIETALKGLNVTGADDVVSASSAGSEAAESWVSRKIDEGKVVLLAPAPDVGAMTPDIVIPGLPTQLPATPTVVALRAIHESDADTIRKASAGYVEPVTNRLVGAMPIYDAPHWYNRAGIKSQGTLIAIGLGAALFYFMWRHGR